MQHLISLLWGYGDVIFRVLLRITGTGIYDVIDNRPGYDFPNNAAFTYFYLHHLPQSR